jgi:hypothetical protein
LLTKNGVTVYHLSDLVTRNTELLERLPNLAYLHDIAAVSTRGAIVSKMASQGRSHEEIPVLEAFSRLGIPILYEPNEGDVFEGCCCSAAIPYLLPTRNGTTVRPYSVSSISFSGISKTSFTPSSQKLAVLCTPI